MGARDRMRRVIAVGFAPACREPRRRIVLQRIAFEEYFLAGSYEIAQDTIDESRIRRVFRLKPGRADGKIDGSMIGNVEKENLGRRRDQGPFEVNGLARQAFFYKRCQGGADCAKPAQCDGDDRACQGDVARFQAAQPRENRGARKTFIERVISRDDIVQDRSSGETRGKTGAILTLFILRGNHLAWPAVRNPAAAPSVCRRVRRISQTRDSAVEALGTRIMASY